ncbi:MAG: hypothetical protein ACLGI9_26015, partial [Thermoanaerobaculia bacterium]
PEGPVNIGVEPLDTWADMTQLLARESWPPGQTPRGLSFFVSAMRDDPGQPLPPDPLYPPTQTRRVTGEAVQLFESHVGHVWPNAVGAGGFRWDVLQAPPSVTGPARLELQYLRANIDPNERYVLSVPGSSVHRLLSGASGFENLYLAGDWVYTGLNAGCMECAVMGGMQASRAISGFPQQIYGEKDFGQAPPRRSTESSEETFRIAFQEAATPRGEPEPSFVITLQQDRSGRAADPRRDTEDRIGALGLVALTAFPAALVAVPAAAAIWLICGKWTRGYDLARTVLRTPLELAKDTLRRNTGNLTPEEHQRLEELLRKV